MPDLFEAVKLWLVKMNERGEEVSPEPTTLVTEADLSHVKLNGHYDFESLIRIFNGEDN